MKNFSIISQLNFVKELTKVDSSETYFRVETNNLGFILEDKFVTKVDLGLTINRKLDVFNIQSHDINKDKLKSNQLVKLDVIEGIEGQDYILKDGTTKKFDKDRFHVNGVTILRGLEIIDLYERGLLSKIKFDYLMNLQEIQLKNELLKGSMI
jgi:hypothetical protein